ncbi:MAG TPA: prepilin-type N-terminal cleavage/methylation domain-containing protein [Phycisphaerae bacterium]|nr:prepilin-type N-terminal cleavage/methylation domain-containing protein [Phycisphaerae bacterium]
MTDKIVHRADRCGRRMARARRAFTLVELLIVISIIVLLVTILTPALNAVRRSAMAARSSARISELSNGAGTYYQDNGNLYPGQRHPNVLGSGSGKYTGSQVLAARLFGYAYAKINTADPGGSGKYAPVTAGDLVTVNTKMNSVSDRFSKDSPKAILYYPSRLGKTDLSQFVVGDNSPYTGAAKWTSFNEYIRNENLSASSMPYNAGKFLLIAPGADREYGTQDDVKNW